MGPGTAQPGPRSLCVAQCSPCSACLLTPLPLPTALTSPCSPPPPSRSFPDWRSARDVEAARSVAVLPLAFSGEPQGCLLLHSPLPHVMDAAFVDMLQTLAGQLGQVRAGCVVGRGQEWGAESGFAVLLRSMGTSLQRRREPHRAIVSSKLLLCGEIETAPASTRTQAVAKGLQNRYRRCLLLKPHPHAHPRPHSHVPRPAHTSNTYTPVCHLSQVMYLKRALEDVRADEQLLSDLMPSHVAHTLKRRFMSIQEEAQMLQSYGGRNLASMQQLGLSPMATLTGMSLSGGALPSFSTTTGTGTGTDFAGLATFRSSVDVSSPAYVIKSGGTNAGAAEDFGSAGVRERDGSVVRGGRKSMEAYGGQVAGGEQGSAEGGGGDVSAAEEEVAGGSVVTMLTPVGLVYQQWHPNVTVLFADVVSFTPMSQAMEPQQVGAGKEAGAQGRTGGREG